MSSVSFSNGVKVNFDTLTASSIDTKNEAALTGTLAAGTVTNADSTAVLSYSNLQAFDDSSITNSTGNDFAIANDAGTLTATINGKEFTATVTAANRAALGFTTAGNATGDTKDSNLTFKDEDGKDAFTIDVTSTYTDNGEDVTLADAAAFVRAADANGAVINAGHNYASIFSASSTDKSATTASSFSVDESFNAGLTFQVGANEGDEMTSIRQDGCQYLGVGHRM
jgi:hypothetical protein